MAVASRSCFIPSEPRQVFERTEKISLLVRCRADDGGKDYFVHSLSAKRVLRLRACLRLPQRLQLGISEWVPSRYWALALPSALVVAVCSYTLVYGALSECQRDIGVVLFSESYGPVTAPWAFLQPKGLVCCFCECLAFAAGAGMFVNPTGFDDPAESGLVLGEDAKPWRPPLRKSNEAATEPAASSARSACGLPNHPSQDVKEWTVPDAADLSPATIRELIRRSALKATEAARESKRSATHDVDSAGRRSAHDHMLQRTRAHTVTIMTSQSGARAPAIKYHKLRNRCKLKLCDRSPIN